MTVFRITKSSHAKDLSGYGSTLVEGRWHLAGALPVVYTASNRSLAILEVLAHLPSPAVKPLKLTLLEIAIPDSLVVTVKETDLPKGWRSKTYQPVVQQWGTSWLRGLASLSISIPSVISKDQNILINPLHPDFKKITIVKAETNFMMDERLI